VQTFNRRRFIGSASFMATAYAADLSFLAQLGHAAASNTTINPDEVLFGPETGRLLRLLRNTSREECIPAFTREVKSGLSYQQFLTVLFLAAVENGDPHQIAQVYGAHRISSDARVEERLLPLFWVLNRIKRETETGGAMKPALKPFRGQLPNPTQAAGSFRDAMLRSDRDEAERAALAMARDGGARRVLLQLWEFAPRNVAGNLGHPAIALANSVRALDAMGWQHAEVALRYVTTYIASYQGDNSYVPNLERTKQTLSRLPPGWAGAAGDEVATLEVFKLLRTGDATKSCDLICSQLLSQKVSAGAIWDAISLAAADAVARHRTGGNMLGAQIHAVTTTNALRFGFNLTDDPEVKLINLLQASGVLCDFYVAHVNKQGDLREVSLLDLRDFTGKPGTVADLFDSLPVKSREYSQKTSEERAPSDQACQRAFDLLRSADNQASFMKTARSFLCVKASLDPHDIKYPAAVFEDVGLVNAAWRPYVLASSVHALHGGKSSNTEVLVQVRDALR
jgi:hypothetical protein